MKPINDPGLTAERLHELLDYDHETGIFTILVKSTGKWKAQIMRGGRHHHLGLFVDIKEAHAAYVAAATLTFGEFARAA